MPCPPMNKQHPTYIKASVCSLPLMEQLRVSERSEYTNMLNFIPLFRFPMLAQVQLLSEMPTYMLVGFQKQ